MRRHGGDILELGVGVHDEAVVDIDDFFPQDNGGAFQRETVECGGNRPLDGVLLLRQHRTRSGRRSTAI